MSPDILIALQITVVGMGLVFGAILLLWALMAALVRLAPEPEAVEEADADPAAVVDAAQEAEEWDRKRRAAAAAVAIALADASNGQPQEFPLPETPIVSAWQAVMRSTTLSKRGRVR